MPQEVSVAGADSSRRPPASRLLLGIPSQEIARAIEILDQCGTVALPSGSSREVASLPSVRLLLVEEGLVLVRRADSRHRRSFVACEAGAGAILLQPAHDQTLYALTNARLTPVSHEAYDALSALPSVARSLFEGLEETAREARETACVLAELEPVDRLRSKLIQLGREHGHVDGNGIRLDLPITHQLLAEMVGLARETVTRALNILWRDGILVRDGREYRLLISPDRLAD
jgi:CRP-like cAMP-binding protein